MPDRTPIPASWVPLTGHWICPLCVERIPITLYAIKTPAGFDYQDSPAPWADVYAHIFAEHPEGMD